MASSQVRSLVIAVGALTSATVLAGCGLGGGTASPSTTAKKTTTLPTQQVTVPPLTSVPTTVVPTVPSTNQPGPGASTATSATTYTVQAGDAWFSIAQKLGVDLQGLLDANGMTLTTSLFPGMRLNVPPKSSPSLPPAAPSSSGTTTTTRAVAVGGSYTVVANDYWAGIASKLGVKLADLLAVNGATSATVIHPGQVLKVPKGATTPTTTKAGATTTAATTTTVKKP